MKLARALATLSLLVLGALPATAQQVRIEAPRPAKPAEARIVPPPLHYQTTRPPDADYYPESPRVEHNPAFIEPFSKAYTTSNSSGRVGLSGWTSPTPPVGPRSMYDEWTGVLAIGFSVTWDGPPPAPAASKRPPR